MLRFLVRFWRDERGALVTSDWAFVATILALGCVSGLIASRPVAVADMEQFAAAVVSLRESNRSSRPASSPAPASLAPVGAAAPEAAGR